MSRSKSEIDFEAIRTGALVIESDIVQKKSLALKVIKDRCRSIIGGVDHLREQRKLTLDVPLERETVIAMGKKWLREKRNQILKDLMLPELLTAQNKKSSPFASSQWAFTVKSGSVITPEVLFYLVVSENELDSFFKELPPGGMTPEIEARIKQIDDQIAAYAAELKELKEKASVA